MHEFNVIRDLIFFFTLVECASERVFKATRLLICLKSHGSWWIVPSDQSLSISHSFFRLSMCLCVDCIKMHFGWRKRWTLFNPCFSVRSYDVIALQKFQRKKCKGNKNKTGTKEIERRRRRKKQAQNKSDFND